MSRNQKRKEKKNMERWQKAGVIFTGLGVVVAIVIYLLSIKVEREIDLIKRDIVDNISTIEKTFNPDETVKKDSLLATFQRKSLELCALWKALDEPINYSLYVNDIEKLKTIFINDFADRIDSYGELIQEITTIGAVLAIKDQANSKYSVVNYSKLQNIVDFYPLKTEVSKQYHDQSISYLQQGLNRKQSGKEYKSKIKKAFDQLNKMKKKPNYYKVDKEIFSFILETNNLYLSHVHL